MKKIRLDRLAIMMWLIIVIVMFSSGCRTTQPQRVEVYKQVAEKIFVLAKTVGVPVAQAVLAQEQASGKISSSEAELISIALQQYQKSVRND